jgi:hypothetical protein
VSIVLCYEIVVKWCRTSKKDLKMKTKSVRAQLEDAGILEQTARELAAELQRQVTVSEIIHELMEGIGNAKGRIKNTTK